MRQAVLTVLFVLATVIPAAAQDFRPNQALGDLLSKKSYIAQPNNAGGKNILDNSCIFKDSFALSPSEPLDETCNIQAAVAKFTTQYGQPATTAPAPGGKTILEYFLLYNNNSYHVKIFLGCSGGKTESFAMVECKVERNRAKPGPPKDKKSFWKKISPF
ncbi:hypothetical protein [Solidesulfovibrio sp. C21]|uniref:hypothetical protein n=1 Tax=Solidesulfovibrio sp. C21 TaxID=3398613 RepID=UPI0039FCCD5F